MRRSPRFYVGLGGGVGLLSVLLFACSRILGIEPGHERHADAATDAPVIDRETTPPPLGKADASCGDTTKDPKNCGECGRDCRGGECTNGRCSPYVFMLGLKQPQAIAVTNEGVYWTDRTENGNGVRRCDLAGCANGIPRTLFERNFYYSDIAVQDDRLYAVRYNGVDTCNTLGCGGTPDVMPINPLSFTVTPQNTYYAAPAASSEAGVIPGGVFRCTSPSCTSKASVYPKGQGVRALGADLYIVDGITGTSSGSVIRCIGANCSVPTILASGLDYVQGAFVAAKQGIGFVSYKDNDISLVICEPNSCAGGQRMLAKVGGYIEKFAFDDTYLYWVNSEYGTLERVPWKGNNVKVEVVLTKQGLPMSIAMQDGALYFTRMDFGDIVRLVPPP